MLTFHKFQAFYALIFALAYQRIFFQGCMDSTTEHIGTLARQITIEVSTRLSQAFMLLLYD